MSWCRGKKRNCVSFCHVSVQCFAEEKQAEFSRRGKILLTAANVFKEGGRRGKQMPWVKVGYLFSPRKRWTDNKSISSQTLTATWSRCSRSIFPWGRSECTLCPPKNAWRAHSAQREARRRDFSLFKKKYIKLRRSLPKQNTTLGWDNPGKVQF